MTATWKTKWGVRRVRRDTPTIEEALIAAESLASDPGQRAEIAASLMGVPVDEVKALAAKQAAKTRGRASLVAGRTRAVVVEYKRPRIGHGPMSRSPASADARAAQEASGVLRDSPAWPPMAGWCGIGCAPPRRSK